MTSGIKYVEGISVPVPINFVDEYCLLMRDLPLRDGDVIISTYPKCGTNWTLFIVWSLQHPNEDPPDGTEMVKKHIPMVDLAGLGKFTGMTEGPRTLSTHLPSDMVSNSPKAKYIIVARNPLDAVVSAYHFYKTMGYTPEGSDNGKVPASHFESFLDGKILYGDFFQHVKGWYNRRNEPNVHFVTYEEMKKDTRGEIIRIARFLGLDKQLVDDDGEILDKVLRQCSFDYMKTKYEGNVTNAKGENSKLPIVRQGTVGSYKTDLTEEQVRRLREKMEKELEGTDLLKQWTHL